MAKFIITSLFICSATLVMSQSIVDGFFRGKGKVTTAISFTNESADQFFRGTEKSDIPSGVINKLTITSINTYIAYGLHDRLDIVGNIPYISVKGDRDDGVMGAPPDQDDFQKASLFLKYLLLSNAGESGDFSAVVSLGTRFPLSNYEQNFPTSIGNRATEFEGVGLVQYKFKSGFFGYASAGYALRDNDVPNAINNTLKVGYAGSKIYADLWYSALNSTDGSNIGDEGFLFYETEVDFKRMGVTLCYNLNQNMTFILGGGSTLDGRNVSNTSWYSVGMAFNFDSPF